MEKKQRTNTNVSTSTTPQEAAATLDPLVQLINEQDSEPVYNRRRSSIFYVPTSTVKENEEENIDKKQLNPVRKCFICMQRFSGILYALTASFLFTCSNFALKQCDVVMLDVLVIRMSVQTLISLGFILYKGYRPVPSSHGLLVIVRSVFAAGGTISYYIGLSMLPLPDLTTIRYTQVVWTALLALIIFRERITISTITASILTLVGVACVAQPVFIFSRTKIQNETLQNTTILNNNNNNHMIGTFAALACALSVSISILLNKKLIEKNVRQSIIMFYFLLITLIASIILQIHYWIFAKSNQLKFNFKEIFLKKDFIFASIITILQLFPMVLVQKSIKREHPSIVTVVQSTDILFAIILQNIFSSIKTNLLAVIGSILVLTSIVIVGVHKVWLDRQNRTYLPTSTEENLLQTQPRN